MFVFTDLPKYNLFGLEASPGDILGRTKPGSLIEHRAMLCFDGEIVHTSGPGDIFRPGRLEEILKDGGVVRIVHATTSLEEMQRRLMHADRLIGVLWWDMNCHQTTDYIVHASRIPWLT